MVKILNQRLGTKPALGGTYQCALTVMFFTFVQRSALGTCRTNTTMCVQFIRSMERT